MGGSDDDDDDDGNLPLLTPRTKAFLSSLLREDPPPPGNGSEAPTPVPDRQNPCLDSADGGGGDAGRKDPGAPKPGLGVGLTERIAARAGFNAPRLDTSQIRSVILGSSPPGVEPYRIPLSPGFSPSAFLDSPVLLFNSLAQPSPTTGKFPLGQCNNTSSLPISETADKNKITILMDADDVKPFAFNSHTGMSSSSLSNTTNKTDVALAQQQLLSSQEASAQPEFSNQAKSLDADPEKQQEDHRMSDFSEPTDRKDRSVDFMFDQKLSNSAIYNKNSSPSVDQREGDVQKGELSLVPVGQPSEDGYNWRKYGQKQVKGSEFPRSYYKCTHPSCQVKKKVERSPEGQVAEIIYKGVHNHSIPPLNHQASVPSSNPIGDRQNDAPERQAVRPITLNGTDNQEWSDRVGASPNVPKTTEFCDPSMSVPMQFVPCFESSGAIDLLSTPSNQDNGEEEDDGAHGNEPLGVDGGDEESELKRRKLEASVADMSSASRAVREPRVVVQTTSEVDILDDGYRWRKYGQKVVKGNPNPRSYYKCTSVGCTVRKHVERASHDLKSVITTYEGKHNHEVPMARNSSHSNTGPSGMSSQSQNVQRRSDPSHAQQKFPVFDTTAALGSFDMLPAGREQLGPSAAISLGLSQPSLTSLAVVGLVPADPMKMLPQVHAYLGQKPMNEPGYAIPKGVVEEQMTKPSLPIPNAGSVHQQIMGRLPLGPEQ